MRAVHDVAVRLRRRREPASAVPAGVCAAPFVSMYLDQHGSVRACCQNVDHPLGNVTESSLEEIWASRAARALRDAMLDHDLEHGCAFCKWQVDEGNDGLVFARTFDHLRPESTEPEWPKQLELSMSNACNLQCTMCNGDWSSSIRTHREGRPPLPQVYDDRFFDELRPFLEHVEVVKILGGEPFLGKESLRVMEMLVEMGSTAEVHVTTNGTQWSPRVERILEKLPMVIVVSLDGVDKASYEAIRVGADLDVVLENIDRFRRYADSHGTAVNLAHCLMTSNWRHFPDFLRFAEGRQLRAYVNTVTHPTSLSMFHLSQRRLREVVDHFTAVDAEMRAELSLNRPLWIDQLERLRHRLDGLSRGEGVDYYLGVAGFSFVHPPEGAAPHLEAEPGDEEPCTLQADLDLNVIGFTEGPRSVAGVPLDDVVGRGLEGILGRLGARYGTPEVSSPSHPAPDTRQFSLAFPEPGSPLISALLLPRRDDDGVLEEFEIQLLARAAPAPADGDGDGDGDLPSSAAPSPAEGRFVAAHPSVHVVEIGADSTIVAVDPLDSALGGLLAGAVGEASGGLLDLVSAALGGPAEVTPGPSDGETSSFVARVAGADGEVVRLEALVVPVAGRGLDDGGSRLLIAEDRWPAAAEA